MCDVTKKSTMTVVGALRAWWRWLRTPAPPGIPCVLSFDVHDKQKWVVTITGLTAQGVYYTHSPFTPPHLVQYVRQCNNVVDFWLKPRESLHFVFYENELTVVAGVKHSGKTAVRVPYQEDGFRVALTGSDPLPSQVRLAKPTLHWDGHMPMTGTRLVVHPFWEGSVAVLLVSGEGYQNLLEN